MDDVRDIAGFYDEDPRREHERLEQHQLEHDLTWRYLERYLPRAGHVLELGAATGRYSIELARRGYEVTAVDLAPALVRECARRVKAAGLQAAIRSVVADARDLSTLDEDRFDAVLVMGPLYHLIEAEDRREVLRGVYARLRPGGVVVSAFLSRTGVIGDLLRGNPGWIEDRPLVRSLIEHGRRPDGSPPGGFRGYFARVPEIAPLHEEQGFESVALAAVEPAIGADDECFNRLEGGRRRLWLDLLEELGTEPTALGASRHLLYVGRRPEHG